MKQYSTNYGVLKSISLHTTYENQQIKECVLNEQSELNTSYGLLVPQYKHTGTRQKHTYSVSFYKSGTLKRIALNNQVEIDTSIGKLPAELITFYESGKIKKIFPLNGMLSAYWEEEDEYTLAKELYFDFPFGKFKTKIISIGFYENGTIKSLTLWPKEYIYIDTPIGKQQVRMGLSLHPDGSIKSIEPAKPIDVKTPIGKIKSFDINASGISGDKNSLVFNEDGSLYSLISSNTKVIVKGIDNVSQTYTPFYIGEMYDHEVFFQTLKIEFSNGFVKFNSNDEYKIQESSFIIEPYINLGGSKCSDCSSCTKCSANNT